MNTKTQLLKAIKTKSPRIIHSNRIILLALTVGTAIAGGIGTKSIEGVTIGIGCAPLMLAMVIGPRLTLASITGSSTQFEQAAERKISVYSEEECAILLMDQTR